MLVSIVIPFYNQLEYVRDAIDSAKDQTYEDIEIVIVDDGSTQDLTPVRQSYQKDAAWIAFLKQSNKGLSAARNAGIEFARGEWILPLDADDKISPEYISKSIAYAQQKNVDIVSTYLRTFGRVDVVHRPEESKSSYEHFLDRNRINCCSMFKRSMWQALGGYDENMRIGFEDWDFWIRATQAGYKVGIVPEELFFYRKRGPSMLTAARKQRAKILAYMRTKYPLTAL
jgi:glycosyltransferase involved in cell wall biosynthesis